MNANYSQMVAMIPEIEFMLSLISLVSVYAFLKSAVWWLLFGTGRLLFRKYTLAEWVFRSGMGLAAFMVLALFNVILWNVYRPENDLYIFMVGLSFLGAARITLREIFSLFGLLRGDWNPFHPHLRFIAWSETYLLCWLGNGSSSGRRKETPWGSYADQEAAYWYQNLYNRQNGYT